MLSLEVRDGSEEDWHWQATRNNGCNDYGIWYTNLFGQTCLGPPRSIYFAKVPGFTHEGQPCGLFRPLYGHSQNVLLKGHMLEISYSAAMSRIFSMSQAAIVAAKGEWRWVCMHGSGTPIVSGPLLGKAATGVPE